LLPPSLKSYGGQVVASAPRNDVDKSRHASALTGQRPALRSPHAPDAAASTASHPNVRDDGQRPSYGDGTARDVVLIWAGGEGECFWKRGWTGQIRLKRFNKSGGSRSWALRVLRARAAWQSELNSLDCTPGTRHANFCDSAVATMTFVWMVRSGSCPASIIGTGTKHSVRSCRATPLA
jgi:hypothetical protein